MEEPEVKKVENNYKKPGTASQTPKPERKLNTWQRPMKRRQREAVVFKLNNIMKLSKKEENILAKKTSTHIWSHCLNWYECTNRHCWLTYKTGNCEKCG